VVLRQSERKTEEDHYDPDVAGGGTVKEDLLKGMKVGGTTL
jgi:hypothetical protein